MLRRKLDLLAIREMILIWMSYFFCVLRKCSFLLGPLDENAEGLTKYYPLEKFKYSKVYSCVFQFFYALSAWHFCIVSQLDIFVEN